MPNYQYTNPKGQGVGYVEGKVYKTVRNSNKNEIFRERKNFGNLYIENAVAIGKMILDDLLIKDIIWMEITIIGIEEKSFKKYIDLREVKRRGIKIKFQDVQVVFDYMWGFDGMQTRLAEE